MFGLPGKFVVAASGVSLALALFSSAPAAVAAGFGGVITDDEPANNTPQGARVIPMGGFSAKIGTLSLTPGDVDIIKVFMPQGSKLTVITTPLSGPTSVPFRNPDTRVTIKDPAGGVQIVNEDAGSDFPADTQTHGSVARYHATADGVVTIEIAGTDAFQVGQYVLMISLSGAVDQNFIEPEPSESPAQALALGMPACGPIGALFTLATGNDVDFMSVDLRQGDILIASSTSLAGLGFFATDTLMSLIDTDGVSVLAVSDDDAVEAPQSLSSTIRFRANRNGRYFIRVESFEQRTFGPYEMTMCVVARSDASACPADLNGDGTVNSSDLSLLLATWGGCR